MAGRMEFVVAVLVREGGTGSGMETALSLGEAVREAVMEDVTRSGLASATGEGAATEMGKAEADSERKPPLVEVRLRGSCGYYVSRREE